MLFEDIPVQHCSYRLKPAKGQKPLKNEVDVFGVSVNKDNINEYIIRLSSNKIFRSEFVEKRKSSLLSNELSSGRSMAGRVKNIADDGSFDLVLTFYFQEVIEIDELEVCIDETFLESYQKKEPKYRNKTISQIGKSLSEEFCFKNCGNNYFLMLAGHSVSDSLIEEDDNLERNVNPKLNINNAFCLVSDKYSFVATKKFIRDEYYIYVIDRFHEIKNRKDSALRLCHGSLKFSDWTNTGKPSILARAQMHEILQDNSSYLNIWDKFGEIEGDALLNQARDFGVVKYSKAISNRDGTTTLQIIDDPNKISKAYDMLKKEGQTAIEIVNSIPEYLENRKLEFKDFSRQILDDYHHFPIAPKIIKFDSSSLRLTVDAEHLEDEKLIILSLQGDITQIKRRNAARKAIVEGRSANPQMGVLLEEKGKITTTRNPKKVVALTSFVKNKVFDNDPTIMQEKAIEVALNTPDIALIQGPPGTGKTTVISAIVERLNQEASKQGKSSQGQVLLTGFQHEAVENMINRMDLNALPVPKFGKKRDEGDQESFSNFEIELSRWSEGILKKIKNKYPNITEAYTKTDLDDLVYQYNISPTKQLAKEIVKRISRTNIDIIGDDLLLDSTSLLDKFAARETLLNNEEYLSVIRNIRTTEEGFLDDGKRRAEDVLDLLSSNLEENDIKLLKKATKITTKLNAKLLDDLRSLKKSLLIRFNMPPEFKIEKPNEEVTNLVERYKEKVQNYKFSNEDKKNAAILQFINDLETNQAGIIDSLAEYSFAFASTCQQSVNKKMQDLKLDVEKDNEHNITYEYVIVDEAARVSPRDLMIPLYQGKRVILVGDHRQLPHIIDEEVAKQVETGDEEVDEKAWLEKSMFEYMFTERLKDLEAQDGIKRRVTLDKQFRMHPILGDFISENFYEYFEPTEKVGSGLDASKFLHNLPGLNNSPVAWLNVPGEYGMHERKGTSWVRKAEIEAIANQIENWMNTNEGNKLKYGVISFYKAQATEIEDALRSKGIDTQKIRIGTVDSFQGMEFDVVFLSMVRVLPERFKDIHNFSESKTGSVSESADNTIYNKEPVQDSNENNNFVIESNNERGLFSKMKSILFRSDIDDRDIELERNLQEENDDNIEEQNETLDTKENKEIKKDLVRNYNESNNSKDRVLAQRTFGHLCLYNRLNVSMSRQKKLLVVVGDSDLVKTNLCKKYVWGLSNFYELCKKQGVIINVND